MEENKECACPSKCPRHGKCSECRAHHAEKNKVPFCERAKQNAEKREQRELRRSNRNK